MVKIQELLEAGVHFGHRIRKWNPKMAPFIFGERNGIHIIDLIQTKYYLQQTIGFLVQRYACPPACPSDVQQRSHDQQGEARHGFAGVGAGLQTVDIDMNKDMHSGAPYGVSPRHGGAGHGFAQDMDMQSHGNSILLVGTKKQASPFIKFFAEKLMASPNFTVSNGSMGKAQAAHYVNHRWLGGLLTNWSTMKVCIERLNLLENQEKNGEFEKLAKKERAIVKKQYEKLTTFFGGIKTMKSIPNLVIIVGQDDEMNAVKECNKLQSALELSTQSPSPSPFGGNKLKASSEFPLTTPTPQPIRIGATQMRTITILDTNCDPSLADLYIPGNDDSAKSIELILNELTLPLCS
jgi:ribosomal protein S2